LRKGTLVCNMALLLSVYIIPYTYTHIDISLPLSTQVVAAFYICICLYICVYILYTIVPYLKILWSSPLSIYIYISIFVCVYVCERRQCLGAGRRSRQNFSELIALLHYLCSMTTELTFLRNFISQVKGCRESQRECA